MAVEEQARPVVDLLDPELHRSDPHDVWTWMREVEPIYRDERNGLWGVTRHRDISSVERDADAFPSHLGYRSVWDSAEQNMIALDGDRHRAQRTLAAPPLARLAVRADKAGLERIVSGVLDQIGDERDIDVVGQIAAPIPARVTCRLLGLPSDRWPDLRRWSEMLMRVDMRDRDGRAFRDFHDANIEIKGMVEEERKVRSSDPPMSPGLLDVWLEAYDRESLDWYAVLHEVGLLVSGGAETTRTAIAHGLRAFCDRPALWEELHRHPELAGTAVDEVLRWVTPLNNFFRRAVQDVEVGGQLIRSGERVVLIYPSANRDDRVFKDPFVFDIRRRPNPHLAFGIGPHRCLGEHLAREDLAVVFSELAARFTNLEVIEEPDIEPNIFVRAVRSFRIAASRR
jgi:cytochrome P450 family 142 subfamily A polypeptide 1